MNTPKPQEIFEGRTNASVMQDKKPPWRFTIASEKPSTASTEADNRPKHHGSETRQTLQISGRVPPRIKSEVQRIAKLKGWTESFTVRALIEQALARNLAEQFGVMLKTTIQEAITTQLKKDNNRAANLALEAFYSAEQGRVISTYALRFLLGEDIDILPEIIKQSQEQAGEALNHFGYEREEADQPTEWQSSK